MNVLVVGGAGYIGSQVAYELSSSGYVPIIYDNLSRGYRDLCAPFTFVEGDIMDKERLIETMHTYEIACIMHFAGYIATAESVQLPALYYSVNVAGTCSLFSAMLEAGVHHIVVSSSASVYGNPQRQGLIKEESPLMPMSPYARTKVMMETMLADIVEVYPINYASLRYFNAVGADFAKRTGQRTIPPTHIIPNLLLAAVGDIPYFSLYGTDYDTPDGTCIRDYIHTVDLATAHIKALEYLMVHKKENIVVNLGTMRGISNRELIVALEELLHTKIPVEEKPRREGDPSMLVADASKAYALLQWQPHYDLQAIVTSAWEWFMQDREKYPRV